MTNTIAFNIIIQICVLSWFLVILFVIVLWLKIYHNLSLLVIKNLFFITLSDKKVTLGVTEHTKNPPFIYFQYL